MLPHLKSKVLRSGGRSCVIVAFCNEGYVPYTHNLIESLRRLNLAKHLVVFALNEEAKKKLFTVSKFNAIVHKNERKIQASFTNYKKSGWTSIVRTKVEIIHDILQHNIDVMYTDGDVVWLRNPVPAVQSALTNGMFSPFCYTKNGRNNVLAFQLDGESKHSNQCNFCTGFFYAKSCPQTKLLFDKKAIPESFDRDQPYINRRLKVLKLANLTVGLKPTLFYSGRKWYASKRQGVIKNGKLSVDKGETPFIIHFNWKVGHKKQDEMKKSKLWLVK